MLALLLALLAASTPAAAFSTGYDRHPGAGYMLLARQDGVPWQALGPQEQELLKKHRGNWSGYSPAEQQQLREGARRYLELPPGKRKAVEQQRKQYEKMSPGERKRLREEYRKEKH